MNLTCSRCGGPIGRQNGPGGRRKFCATCSPPRERKDRPRKRPLRPVPPPQLSTSTQLVGEINGMVDATRAELQQLGADEDHWRSVLALLLAHHVDHADGVGAAGLVAMIREHDALMGDIRARCAG